MQQLRSTVSDAKTQIPYVQQLVMFNIHMMDNKAVTSDANTHVL